MPGFSGSWGDSASRRFAIAIALVAIGLATLPSGARAAGGSISIAGTTSVARGLHASFQISGFAPAPDRKGFPDNEVLVVAIPASQKCENTGLQSSVDSNLGFSAQVHGPAPFDFSWEPPVENFLELGDYTLCATLLGGDFEFLAGSKMTMTVVKPELRLRESVPHHLRVGESATFAVSGRLQAAAYLETQIVPSRILVCGAASCHLKRIHRCASTPQAEEKLIQESESVTYPFYASGATDRPVPAGPFHFSRRLHAESPGLYRMCSWLTEQGENEDPAQLFVTASWRVSK